MLLIFDFVSKDLLDIDILLESSERCYFSNTGYRCSLLMTIPDLFRCSLLMTIPDLSSISVLVGESKIGVCDLSFN